MVKHIVFFKIKEDIADKNQAINKVIETLSPLAEKIPEIKFYELGTNFADRDSAFDIALVSYFNSKEDLDTYRNHDLHKQAVEIIKPYIGKTAVVDYETNKNE